MDPISVAVATTAATVAAGAVKGAKGPAQFVDDVMEIVGFGKVTEFADKKRVKRELSIEGFVDEISRGINDLEPENIQQPKFSIVGPALEASKFYFEEEDLRDMFAKIIIASVDSSKNNLVHQSFVEIIKQLSVYDAKHLVQIKHSQINPIISISIKMKDEQGKKTIKKDLFLSDHLTNNDHSLVSASLVNLQRLGLIEIVRGSFYTTETHYDALIESDFTNDIKDIAQSDQEIIIDKEFLQLTSFGNNFCDVCL